MPSIPKPPYPPADNQILVGIVKQALLKFEQGGVSVAGAIMAAAQSTWAVGHQEGEDLCVGCTHRPLTLPARVAPHARCFSLAITIMEQTIKTYLETWLLLARQGAIRFPQTEQEMRGMYSGLQSTFKTMRDISQNAIKKG